MDVFNTALNTIFRSILQSEGEAHQHARMAESLDSKQMFSEAIECHRKAADELEKARDLTASVEALKSIDLQRSYHERQILIVEEKFRRMTESLSTVSLEPENDVTASGVVDSTVSQVTQPYATLDLCHDTMLKGILREKNASAPENLAMRGAGDEFNRLRAKKINKDEKTVIEEQATTIRLLREHIHCKETECDSLQKELGQMRDVVSKLRSENLFLKQKLDVYEKSEGNRPATSANDASKFDFEVIPGK